MSEPINICPYCHAPFTKGKATIERSEDIKIHYWWHKLEYSKPPVMNVTPDIDPGIIYKEPQE